MEFKAGQIIVKFKGGISQSRMQSLLRAEDVSILDERDDFGLMLLSVPEGQELEKAEELRRSPLVEYAEPNYIVKAASSIAVDSLYSLRALHIEPDDPYYPGQWNLHKIEAPAGWDITTGNNRVVIAVLSTGVDPDHEELKDKIWTNSDEEPDNEIDDDQNGYIDDVHGWDFVLENWDNEPWDDRGNGTFDAIVAAAETNNGVGLAGVSWGAKIMPIKVLDYNGGGDIYEITPAIQYAADNGARVLLLNFIVFGYSHTLEAFIDDAYKKGALVVAPMGDCAEGGTRCRDLENPVLYPAAFPHVLAVAATDQNDEHYFISGHKSYTDVAAPGTDIVGGYHLTPGYGRMSSTHAASPHVAGLAALVWSVNPTLTPDEVESIIEATAADLGEPGWDENFGHGRIDASAAVRATPHYLEVEPDEGFYFLVCDDCDPSPRKIINPNTSCSTWSATTTANWLSISPCSPIEGYIPSSREVSVDRDNLPDYGLYTAVITVTSEMTNYANNPKTIPTTVKYTSQCWGNYLPLLFKDS
ncbi:MAG TPA: hypothetical protein EYP49_05880 [Anaerolineae bacterium]|nr:hypothetical protein [Anaerolineae bacterium]